MNIRISAIATNVMLVTVMPRNSRSIRFSIGKPRSGRNRSGGRSTLRTVRNTPVSQLYSEVNTLLNHRRKWNFRSGYFVTPAAILTATQGRWFGARRVFGIDTGSAIELRGFQTKRLFAY
jgi:hypothetical protein